MFSSLSAQLIVLSPEFCQTKWKLCRNEIETNMTLLHSIIMHFIVPISERFKQGTGEIKQILQNQQLQTRQ